MGRAQDSTLPFKRLNIGLDIEQKPIWGFKKTGILKFTLRDKSEQKNEIYQKESSIYRSNYS